MSRKQFKVAGSSHEKKLSKKERKAQIGQNIKQEEIVPTEQDTVQIKNLTKYAVLGIGLLLMLMYMVFMSGL
jgi:hypothetical protein